MTAATGKGAATPLTEATLAQWPLPSLDKDADKESRGRVLVVAGSREMPGACMLAAIAALRAGAGKLLVAAPESIALGLALAIPEARFIGLPEAKNGGLLLGGCRRLEAEASGTAALVLGPGMVDEKRSAAFVGALLPLYRDSITVLDAFAMSALGYQAFDQPIVITPHAGEMAHLTGRTKREVTQNSLEVAREAAALWNVCVALKGGKSVLARPDGHAWQFAGGGPGLATSGSGDTLVGLMGGFAARGLEPIAAAAWGVVTHALAGRALSERLGPMGYLARELPAKVPGVAETLAAGMTSTRSGRAD